MNDELYPAILTVILVVSAILGVIAGMWIYHTLLPATINW